MSPGRCVPTPAAAATPAEGLRRRRPNRERRGGLRRARAAPAPGLHPAPLQTGREPERRRTEGDVEHGRERRLPDRHVGTVEDADHDQPDRPARGKARGGEEEQQSLGLGRLEQRQDRREARPGPQAAEQPEDERLETHRARLGGRRTRTCRAHTNRPDARSHAMTQVSSNRPARFAGSPLARREAGKTNMCAPRPGVPSAEVPPSPLSAFTPAVRDWFAARVRGPHAGPGAGVAGDRDRRARAHLARRPARARRSPRSCGRSTA